MGRRAAILAAFLMATCVVTGTVWWFALRDSLSRLAERGQADLALAGDRLTGQLQRYREMTVLMADHPVVIALTLDPRADGEAGNVLLRRTADMTGSDELMLLSAAGRVIASSGHDLGADRSAQPHFHRAMQGALGFAREIEPETGRRLFVYAAPVFSPGGPVSGALVARIETEAVEVTWRGDPMIVFFTDDTGVAFVSNRDELILAQFGGAEPTPELAALSGAARLRQRATSFGGYDIWTLDAGPHLPERTLHLTRDLPVVEMVGESLVDIAPAERQASLVAAMAAAASIGLGAVVFALMERRRALAERLASEAKANALLETRVAERTRELSEANDQLHRAQADLVQAGKLSALGQMSAGISHELNQPLMAIRSYAENATLFLERNMGDKAADNLGRISDLARRMGRIIKNLRAFARQESEAVNDVDLVQVVAAALELTEARLRAAGVTVDWTAPVAPLWVRGGEVRLQQVLVNLISNAADAMGSGGVVAIGVSEAGGRVRLTVRDSGPGIAEPDRIFDPFYTTKEVGASEGMGLGLSISYGIVKSFGGEISGRNRPEGGAEFIVDLAASHRRIRAA
jgi:two-component system, NtrC family, C4-dicarboxylate transport sensor histidine kinase DctB